MRLIGLAVVLALGFPLIPLAAEAQQAGKVYRLGYLSEGSAAERIPPGVGLNGLTQGLRDLGWTEGVNRVIESRFAEGKSERLAGLAAELDGGVEGVSGLRLAAHALQRERLARHVAGFASLRIRSTSVAVYRSFGPAHQPARADYGTADRANRVAATARICDDVIWSCQE